MSIDMDPLEAIRHQLDKTDDPTLLILKTHLLVEERLRDILARISWLPDELRAARLSFHQVFCLCRAVVGRHDESTWDFVARLNEVRNKMAHHLDPGDLDELLGSVVTKLRTDYPEQVKTPVDRFRLAAIYTCGYFDAIKGSVRLRKAYASDDEV
jgi:hypothetical protein